MHALLIYSIGLLGYCEVIEIPESSYSQENVLHILNIPQMLSSLVYRRQVLPAVPYLLETVQVSTI